MKKIISIIFLIVFINLASAGISDYNITTSGGTIIFDNLVITPYYGGSPIPQGWMNFMIDQSNKSWGINSGHPAFDSILSSPQNFSLKVDGYMDDRVCRTTPFKTTCTYKDVLWQELIDKPLNVDSYYQTENVNGTFWVNLFNVLDLDPPFIDVFTSALKIYNNQTEAGLKGVSASAPQIFFNFNQPNESAYYPDNSIHNRGGAVVGSILYNESCNSPAGGGCLTLDGKSDYIDGSGTEFLDDATEVTISAWVTTGDSGGFRAIMTSRSANRLIELTSSDDNAEYEMLISDPTGICRATSPAGDTPDGVWYHLAGTYNTVTREIIMYVNGTEVARDTTLACANAPLQMEDKFKVGWDDGGANREWNGSIDQVQVWDRELSAYEIQQLYNGTYNNTAYIGQYSKDASFKSLVFFNSTSTWWNTTFDIADSNFSNNYLPQQGNLLGHWTFDNDNATVSFDRQGLRNATISGSTSSVGMVSKSREYDGIDDNVAIAYDSEINFGKPGDNYTISAWFRGEPSMGSYAGIVVAGRDIASEDMPYIISKDVTSPTTNNITFRGFDQSFGYRFALIGQTQVNDTKWHHVTVVHNGSSDRRLYVDGILEDSETNTITATYSGNDPTRIGYWDNGVGNDYYFNGSIDEVMIYNTSLTTAEVQQIYNEQSKYYGVNTSDPRMINYFTFDESYEDLLGRNDGEPNAGTNNNTGISSKGMDFDGTDDYIMLNVTNGDYNVTTGAVSVWVNLKSDSNDNDRIVGMFREQDATNDANFYLGFVMSAGTDYLVAQVAGGGVTKWTANTPVDSADEWLSDWVHIVLVQDGASPEIWVNGVNQTLTFTADNDRTKWWRNAISDTTNGPDSLTVGATRYNGATIHMLRGGIDELMFFNESITDQEIQDLYKAGLSQHQITNTTLSTRVATSYNTTDANLVGVWGFNNDTQNVTGTLAYDELGRSNGSILGSIWAEENGTVGGGYSFDAVADRIIMGNEGDFDFERTDNFSFSAWIKSDSSAAQAIINKADNSEPFTGYNFVLNGGVLQFTLINDNGGGNLMISKSTTNIVDDKWHHVVVAYNGSSDHAQPVFYVDGVQDATVASGNTLSASILNDVSLQVGARGSTGLEFDGTIDELRIYNKTLTASEVSNLYELNTIHIEWEDWLNATPLSDGLRNNNSNKGNFFQYLVNFFSEDTSVSPYVLNYSVSPTNNSLLPDTTFPLINFTDPTQPDGATNVTTEIIANVSITEEFFENQTFTLYNGTLDLGNLTAYWNFDYNLTSAYDYSNNNNNGSIQGAFWNETGNLSGAYEFDGIDDYINIDSSVPSIKDIETGTISLWFRDNDDVFDDVFSVTDASASSKGLIMQTDFPSAGDYRIFFQGLSANLLVATVSGPVSNNEWHHLVYSSGVDGNSMYVDGVKQSPSYTTGSATTRAFFNNASSVLDAGRIGNARTNAGEIGFTNGSIDEVMIFNRTLTDLEVSNLYNRSIINRTSYTTETNFHNWTNLAIGDYHYYADVLDTSNNYNSTEIRRITIGSANSPPSIDEILSQNITGNLNGSVERGVNVTINATVTDPEGASDLSNVWLVIWEGVVETSTKLFEGFMSLISGDLWSVEVATNTSIPLGEVNFTVYANDSANEISQQNGTFTMEDRLPPVLVSFDPENVTLSSPDVRLRIVATDDDGIDYYNYSLDGASNVTFSPNTTITTDGFNVYHDLTVYVVDNSGNILTINRRFFVVQRIAVGESGGGGGSTGDRDFKSLDSMNFIYDDWKYDTDNDFTVELFDQNGDLYDKFKKLEIESFRGHLSKESNITKIEDGVYNKQFRFFGQENDTLLVKVTVHDNNIIMTRNIEIFIDKPDRLNTALLKSKNLVKDTGEFIHKYLAFIIFSIIIILIGLMYMRIID